MPFRNIDDPVKLRRLLESVLLLEADLSLPVLLRHLIEEACSMAGARYGALGVLNDDRTELAEFITVGIDDEVERQIGARPTGKGVLGLLIRDPRPLRMAEVSAHPDSYGFPSNHPPMHSFLGVPVTAHDEVYGNLYLTDKPGWSEFTQDDEELVKALAQAAGIAIENARLHSRVKEVAVFDDRDRIARDLHDAVIQRLFAIGLSLQGLTRALPAEPAGRLSQAVADIDETIRQIRSSIFELGLSAEEEGFRAQIISLVRELEPVIKQEVPVAFEGPIDTAISDLVAEHLLFSLREALTNAGRHAEATRISVVISVDDGGCSLVVADDGRGFQEAASREGEGGLGLVNLRRRAEKLHGELVIDSRPDEGTTITWRVPLG